MYHEELHDDTIGITQRAHEIMRATATLEIIADTLHEVNMDRLADRIESIAAFIHDMAKEMPRLVHDDLNQSIAHGQHMMGGLLMLALKQCEEQK